MYYETKIHLQLLQSTDIKINKQPIEPHNGVDKINKPSIKNCRKSHVSQQSIFTTWIMNLYIKYAPLLEKQNKNYIIAMNKSILTKVIK